MQGVGEEGRRNNLVISELIHVRLASETVERVIGRLVLWYKVLGVALLGGAGHALVVSLPGVDSVAALAQIAHAVGVGSIHVGAVDHAGLEVLVALDSVVQAHVLEHVWLLHELLSHWVVVLHQAAVRNLGQPVVGGAHLLLLGHSAGAKGVVSIVKLVYSASFSPNALLVRQVVLVIGELLTIHFNFYL